MPQAVDSLSSIVDQLTERLRDLEQRVEVLEKAPVIPGKVDPDIALPVPDHRDANNGRQPATSGILPTIQVPSGAIPTLGKAVLGLAGAFLLRAIAESGSAVRLPVLFVAISYACLWMILAIRPKWFTHGSPDRFTSATYAITSVVILCPLLWESIVRFQVLSPTFAAGILATYVGLTLALSSLRELQLIPWIAVLATSFTAVTLIVATGELVPLTAAILGMALATEIAALYHPLTFRVVPAAVADFCVWLLVFILVAESVPEGYKPASTGAIIGLCAALPTIYGVIVVIRVFIWQRRITLFEVGQAAVSFALATFGIIRASHNAAAGKLGIVFLMLAVVCYWATLSRFANEPHTRNRRVTASWAAALLLATNFLLLATDWQVPFLCTAALVTAIVYTRTAKMSLGLHASLYIATAVALSPLYVYIWNALAGTLPAAPEWRIWTAALSAGLCYAVESRGEVDEGRRRLLWVVPASVVAFTIAAWAVTAIARLLSGRIELGASQLSMIRTIVICGLALALAVASRRRHIELRWIAFVAVGIGTLKLVLEDLRFGNPASLVISFLFYGTVLIVLPRLTRAPQNETAMTIR